MRDEARAACSSGRRPAACIRDDGRAGAAAEREEAAGGAEPRVAKASASIAMARPAKKSAGTLAIGLPVASVAQLPEGVPGRPA